LFQTKSNHPHDVGLYHTGCVCLSCSLFIRVCPSLLSLCLCLCLSVSSWQGDATAAADAAAWHLSIDQ